MPKRAVGVLLAVIIVLVLVIPWSIYNRLVNLNQRVDAAWAQVENVLQRRNDLIPNLVGTVKGYARHEKEIFEYVADSRTKLLNAKTTEEKVKRANELDMWLGRLLMIVENYPQLRASENFQKLQDELAGTENRIAVERMRYNEEVRKYNTLAKTVPTKFFANFFGFSPERTYFEAADKAHEVPRVEF